MDFLQGLFAIETVTYTEWEERSRTNNFFELVYVLEGGGMQSVNHELRPFSKEALHLLPAARCYKYIIGQPSTFLFIRFAGSYFLPASRFDIDYSQWFGQLNFILSHHPHHPGELLTDPREKQQVIKLLEVIQLEHEKGAATAIAVVQSALAAILDIISASVQGKASQERVCSDHKFAGLLNFIQLHLTDPEKVTVAFLARMFHISATYFSEYFKRNAGEPFQDFLLKARLNVAVSRARYTQLPVQEIAMDLGFTDSSHLNRMLKKYHGKSIRQIRMGEE
jgi:AraC-like DNA-binding protein